MVEPKAKKSLGKRIIRWTLKSILYFFALTIAWVVLYKWIDPPTTYLHLTCDCSEKTTFHKEWVDSEQISNYMKLAVVASEDNNFMKHGGIDWGAVEKAKKYKETIGKKKVNTAVRVRSHSRPPKMFFYGQVVPKLANGFAKDLKSTSLI